MIVQKYSIEHCIEAAKKRGGICLSTAYINVDTKMEWACEKSHTWMAPFGRVSRGSWCPECAVTKKKDLSHCKALAKERDPGGKCLSRKYVNNRAKMKWQCSAGHIWHASLDSISHMKSWCIICSGKQKLTIQICKEFAKSKGGKCLSVEYKNNNSPIEWSCAEGHNWKAAFKSIKNDNQWCPKCSGGKTQKLLFNIIKTIFVNNIVHYDYHKFDWLKTGKYAKMEIDIYVDDIKLAIEYDGRQHFEEVSLFGGAEGLKHRKKLDKIKNKKIKKHPEDVRHFIRFNYKEPITYDYVINKLKYNNVL